MIDYLITPVSHPRPCARQRVNREKRKTPRRKKALKKRDKEMKKIQKRKKRKTCLSFFTRNIERKHERKKKWSLIYRKGRKVSASPGGRRYGKQG